MRYVLAVFLLLPLACRPPARNEKAAQPTPAPKLEPAPAPPALNDQTARAQQLEAENAALRERIAAMKQPPAPVPVAPAARRGPPRKVDWLEPSLLEVGTYGIFITRKLDQSIHYFRIVKILNENEMVMTPTDRRSSGYFIIRMPTVGLAENRLVDLDGMWEVVGTSKIRSRTYYVVEKFTP